VAASVNTVPSEAGDEFLPPGGEIGAFGPRNDEDAFGTGFHAA